MSFKVLVSKYGHIPRNFVTSKTLETAACGNVLKTSTQSGIAELLAGE